MPSKVACRQADLRDVYVELSQLLRSRLGFVAATRAKQCQSRPYSYSARRYSTVLNTDASSGTFESYKNQLAREYVYRTPNGTGSNFLYQELLPKTWASFDRLVERSHAEEDEKVTIHGYIGPTRSANKSVKFADIVDPSISNALQMTFLKKAMASGFERTIAEGSPVTVHGYLRQRPSKDQASSSNIMVPMFGQVKRDPSFEFLVEEISEYNVFPDDIVVTSETNVAPEQRHLKIRTSHVLREALRQRSRISALCRQVLVNDGFQEIETPILFKSTPEGAREFLVPTRQKGMAYALPQSPQQYKQLLMSSGIPKYFQLAKCFRDEDMRADRQPEFTQLDLEMAFADRNAVMAIIEKLITDIWRTSRRPALTDPGEHIEGLPRYRFERMTYQTAMSLYGSDKPDLRYTIFPIQQSHQRAFPSTFVGMMTSLEDPLVDFIKLDDRFDMDSIKEFLDSAAATPYHSNPAGPPAVLTFDPSKPLLGLSALGHEFADKFVNETEAEPGDTFIFQARQNLPFYGGSTVLGDLRRDLVKFGIERGLIEKAEQDVFAWIVDFPLFKPIDVSEPGQGGGAGIQSTHHPFTAPKTAEDFEHMLHDPLQAVGDHYDLVINGVEVGGGSKRIHNAAVQEHVFREVLKVPPKRVEDFRHLLEALRAGCPPHSGIALGFDRLMTILLDKESVRDVIAFPKWGANGEDKMVKAPSNITSEQLRTYHLSIRDE